MEPPENTKIVHLPTMVYWFDEDGILYSIIKKGPSYSLEEIKNIIENFKNILSGKRICMFVDVTFSNETTMEVRNYINSEFPNFVKAMAIISSSPLGKMLANILFTVKQQPYPVKIFSDENIAREWLKKFL
jgi:hypothetical protein